MTIDGSPTQGGVNASVEVSTTFTGIGGVLSLLI